MHFLTIATDSVDAVTTISQYVYGVHVLGNTEVEKPAAVDVEWAEDSPTLPMSATDAEPLVNEDGYVTVVVMLPQEYVFTYAAAKFVGGEGVEDLAHDAAFDFGVTHDSSFEIVGVSGEDFVVRYTTFLSPHLHED